ncbi:MAG: sugar phosphate isomerase/epimerase family protein [Eubacteriales bacterium]
MKLGIIASPENEATFETVKSLGLDGMEFTVNHNIDSKKFLDDVPVIRKRLAQNGLAALSVGRWGMKRVDDDGKRIPEAFEHDKNVILGASQLGCPVFNCGCNYAKNRTLQENYEIAIGYFADLIAFAKDKNVKIAVYNCEWENFVIEPEQWRVVMPALPTLGIKYDPSHCTERTGGYDAYLPEMLAFGDRFYHFHVKGSLIVGGKRYDDPPAGMDGINWGAVFDILYTKNYAGAVCYEPHSPYWTGKKGRWGIDFSLNYIKPFLMPEDYEGSMASAYSL